MGTSLRTDQTALIRNLRENIPKPKGLMWNVTVAVGLKYPRVQGCQATFDQTQSKSERFRQHADMTAGYSKHLWEIFIYLFLVWPKPEVWGLYCRQPPEGEQGHSNRPWL